MLCVATRTLNESANRPEGMGSLLHSGKPPQSSLPWASSAPSPRSLLVSASTGASSSMFTSSPATRTTDCTLASAFSTVPFPLALSTAPARSQATNAFLSASSTAPIHGSVVRTSFTSSPLSSPCLGSTPFLRAMRSWRAVRNCARTTSRLYGLHLQATPHPTTSLGPRSNWASDELNRNA